jgi:uncharacterized protein (DUF849 family)
MNDEVFITCAVTGGADVAGRSPHVPVTPREIAASALEAVAAGAAIVHIHVREPETGAPSRRLELYRDVVERIRAEDEQVIINLTGGMGGELEFGPIDNPLSFAPTMDFVPPAERIEHILDLRPELASFDCGSVNFGDALYATTPSWLEWTADAIREAGVLPEIEVFDLGQVELAKRLLADGHLAGPGLFQLCLGIQYGAPSTPEAMLAMRNALPPDAIWAGFGLGRAQMPMVAQAVLLGGNVRVGLEDNLFLERGAPATNAQLVERAVEIVERLGARVLDAAGAREKLGLPAV